MAATFIALYRGINVGGKNRVKMEALRALHVRLGHRGVRSYVQSGNIVFSAGGLAEEIGGRAAGAFAREFGFAAKVLVVEAERLREMAKGNPYAEIAEREPATVHVGICADEPSAAGLSALLARTGGGESFVVDRRAIYLHAPDGIGRSKFAAGMEKAAVPQ